MTLREIESRLESEQEKQGVSYTFLVKNGLGYSTVKKIQSGENYQVRRLFNYLNFLCLFLMVDDYVMQDIEELGMYLSQRRVSHHLTLGRVAGAMGTSIGIVQKIENGKGYNRDSLMKYLEVTGDVDFEIVEMVDYFD